MNSSLRTADPVTHRKIVIVSLIAAIVMVVVGISAHTADSSSATNAIQMDRGVVKAGKPVNLTASDMSTIR